MSDKIIRFLRVRTFFVSFPMHVAGAQDQACEHLGHF